jgi:DNA-damage-inducible protein J
MTKTEMIRARVEPELKHDAEEIFDALGLSPTEAITLFYKQVSMHGGLPFEVKIPNTATVKAMQEARAKRGLKRFANLEDMKADVQ